VRVLEEYAAALEAGRTPDRRALQARYPEVAEALGECLEALDFVRAAAPRLKHRAAEQPAGSSPLSEFWPADALGDYRIVRELGRGGMGVVYEVVQVSLGRRVALKVLPFASALDAKQLQRFKNEAQAAAQLHHQNIVPVYGVGCERGVHYYAMQFIDGQTLAALIGELRPLAGRESPAPSLNTATLVGAFVSGRWAPVRQGGADLEATGPYRAPADLTETHRTPSTSRLATSDAAMAATSPAAAAATERSTKSPAFFRTVANLGVQAAAALEHAHAQGVVHRDVKPANLLIDSRGNLWITDFGLAHCQNQAELTMTGDLMGTLRYMSPEQTLAQRVSLDHRTDIYSLGATLYELLTLRPVFDGRDRQELMRQIALEEPRAPRGINAAIPAELETIVLKAIEKSPAERYATAQELADDLQRYLRDEPIRAKPPTLTHQVKKWARRHAGVVRTALAMLALLLVAVAAVASLAAWRLNDERAVTSNQLRLTQAAEANAKLGLYRSLVQQARANRLARRIGQRVKSLEILAEATKHARAMHLLEEDLLELRNEAIACLALPDLRVTKEWDGWPTGSMTIDFDDALERYARVDRQGLVSVRRVADDALLWTLAAFGPGNFGPGNEAFPCFSPGGRHLLLQRGERIKVWDLAEPTPTAIIETSDAGATAFHPDGGQLAVAHDDDGAIDFYDLSTGIVSRQVTLDRRTAAMAFHPHDARLALSGAGGIEVLDLDSEIMQTPMFESAGAFQVAWHPDGKSLAASSDGESIQLWDASSGSPLVRLSGGADGVFFTFNHAGDLLASTCWDGKPRLWDPRTGQQLFTTQASIYRLRFSSDDRLLAAGVSGKKLQVWEIVHPQGYRTVAREPSLGRGAYHRCAVSPRNQLMAAGMTDGVAFWNLATGAPLGFIPLGGTEVLFEPSGELLTSGDAGMLRWPITEDSAGSLHVGPPEKLPFLGAPVAASADGLVLASAQQSGAMAWRRDSPDLPVILSEHYDVRYIDVSPDGRWVATGSHWGTKVIVWDARRGTSVCELPIETGSQVVFSPGPEGKWLATTGDGCRLWAVGTWKAVANLGEASAIAFSPDGRLLAIDSGHGVVRLVDPATGREYARLEDPDQHGAVGLCFSADGARLVATIGASQPIHVWDLRTIRAELARRGLDWNLPSYPPPAPTEGRLLRLIVDRGEPPPSAESVYRLKDFRKSPR
jgi:eukaryotic-like serine/threonine-protein kinase